MKSCNLTSFLVTMTMTIILSLLKLDTGSSKLVVEGSQQRQSQDLAEGGVPTRRQRGLSKTWGRSAQNAKTWRNGQIDGEDQEDRDGDGRNRKGRELKSEECSNGVTGVQSSGGSFCCPEECGECGGSGCSQTTLGANLCCTSAIESSGVLCEDSGEAPCIIIDSTSKLVEMMRPKQELNQDLILPQAETAVMNLAGSGCGSGISGFKSDGGEICCVKGCGQCGGSGCGAIDGYTADDCCEGNIESSGVLCEDTGEAPCIIDTSLLWGTLPNPSPSPIMTIPSSCNIDLPSIRFVDSTGSNGRIYVEGDGCVTMTDIYEALKAQEDYWGSKGVIGVLDSKGNLKSNPSRYTNKWLLNCDLYILDGAVFYCRGSDIGGDCDELRIHSGSKHFELRGHGGNLYFESTEVTSWDTSNKKPKESYSSGRSFISCLSEKAGDETCKGASDEYYGECRMDIIDSKMGYLGFDNSESYGLTWKVRGYCDDESNPEVFDRTNVYGNIMGSEIYENYYGMYTYGHQGGVWTNNRVYDNHQYGFDPHDDSDYLTIANNKVYNNVNHGIIASKRCNNVMIYGNEVYNGGKYAAGIFLHRSSDNAIVHNNYVHDIQDGGITIMESFDIEAYDNVIKNVEYGIRITMGGSRNYIHDNYFDSCATAGFYTYKGSEKAQASDDGILEDNDFVDNDVRNTVMGVYLRDMDGTLIEGNTFTGTKRVEFNGVEDTTWKDNDLPKGACLKAEDSTFTGEEPAESCY